jgi:ubiquinone/menaquinone biosynthesis C-methylase UbiE
MGQDPKKIVEATRQAYNTIAPHFDQTRHHTTWAEFHWLKALLSPGHELLDVGCGNGRLLDFLSGITYTGIDLSPTLIQIAQERYPEWSSQFQVADMHALPFSDASFDRVVAISSLYHSPNRVFRQRALREMFRVLRPGGMVFLVNWNSWQPRFWDDRLRAILAGHPSFFWIPWKSSQGEIRAFRYFAVFTKRQMKQDLHAAGFDEIQQTYIHYGVRAGIFRASSLMSIAKKT